MVNELSICGLRSVVYSASTGHFTMHFTTVTSITPGGPEIHGGQQDQERRFTDAPQSPFRNIPSSVQRSLTRAFAHR